MWKRNKILIWKVSLILKGELLNNNKTLNKNETKQNNKIILVIYNNRESSEEDIHQ